MKAKFINEEFRRNVDPKRNLGISKRGSILDELEKLGIDEDEVTITNDYIIKLKSNKVFSTWASVVQISKKYARKEVSNLIDNITKNKISTKKALEIAYQNGVKLDTLKDVIETYGSKDDKQSAQIVFKKLERSQSEIDEEEEENIYVFIGYTSKKPVTINGEKYYKDEFQVERMVKIDKYDIGDLSSIPIMKIRAKTQYGTDGSVYMLKVPKDFMGEESYSEIPDFARDIVKKYKEKIG